jgi:hypothetical protein
MIKLTRVRTASAIPAGLRGQLRKKKALMLLKGKRAGSLAFKSDYWKPAKEQLKAETHNKCAYCEADTAVVAHGDVEHFRPKSVYWWLAYCYDNYLYSCQVCNQVYKGNSFPIRGVPLPEPLVSPQASDAELQALAAVVAPDPLKDSQGMPMADFRQQAAQELACLVDPYNADPADLFAWDADDVLQEVRLVPLDASVEATSAVQAAQDHLGLNREELRELRWREYHKLTTFKDVLLSGQLIDAALVESVKETIRDMMVDDAPFAGMVRYYVQSLWNLDLD